jgi:CBS domain-containing protein
MTTVAKDVMVDPVFISKDADVEEAAEKLKDAENTLIVKEDDKFAGEVHEHDLMNVLIPEKRLDEEKVIGILGLSFNKSYVAEKVEDLMTHHEVTVGPDEEIGEIAFLMDREDVSAIPVKENDEIIGVVHENQLVKEI